MSKFIWLLYSVALFLIFSLVFYFSTIQKQTHITTLKITEIEKQIALDLPLLDLSNELLKHSGNKAAVLSYIQKFNTVIKDTGIEVIAIEPQYTFNYSLKADQFIRKLNSNHGVVLIVLSLNQPYFTVNIVLVHIILLGLSALIGFTIRQAYLVENKKLITLHSHNHLTAKPVSLVINLNSKTLSSQLAPEQQVSLANKPLCFYLALVEYCIENSKVKLSHQQHVPEELIELANKYFLRLVELGHTIRKRPNFNNSLEKTLSEIRTALDEVLSDYPEYKDIYYPPKAFGEGSRSRMHSYGLVNIAKGNVEIVGK